MTTAAHVLLPREMVERLREYARMLSSFDGTGMRADAHRDLLDLDAALNADDVYGQLVAAAYRVVGAWDNQDGLLAHEMMTHISSPIDRLDDALLALAAAGGER